MYFILNYKKDNILKDNYWFTVNGLFKEMRRT